MKREKRSSEPNKTRYGIPRFQWRIIARYFLVFVIGGALASCFWYGRINSELATIAAQLKPTRQGGDAYQFIDPLLGYDIPNNIKEVEEYQPLVKKINALVAAESSSKPDAFGFYFRDLTLGRWAGVNENAGFAPGSMMKVVLMMAYFKEAEINPSILQKVLAYSSSTADQVNGAPFETPSELQVGRSYTIEQLIEAMIESSDNGAKTALLDNIDTSSLGEISTDLGFSYLDVTQNYANYNISAKQYSVILRALYNATYLSRTYSEKALQIMSQAEYNQGVMAGVPTSTSVAQKFGESVDNSNPQSLEITLSNCGIVYHTTNPYVLCVMTRGTNLSNLTKTIASISRATWEEVSAYATTTTQ